MLVGNETKPIGIVPVSSDSQTFKIKMTFVDDQIAEDEIEDNNKVMGQDVNFDIVVNAVQVTEA